MIRLRRVGGGMVNGIRIEVRTKTHRGKIREIMGILRVIIIGIYMTIKGWIHCRRVGTYRGFRGDRRRNYR